MAWAAWVRRWMGRNVAPANSQPMPNVASTAMLLPKINMFFKLFK